MAALDSMGIRFADLVVHRSGSAGWADWICDRADARRAGCVAVVLDGGTSVWWRGSQIEAGGANAHDMGLIGQSADVAAGLGCTEGFSEVLRDDEQVLEALVDHLEEGGAFAPNVRAVMPLVSVDSFLASQPGNLQLPQ